MTGGSVQVDRGLLRRLHSLGVGLLVGLAALVASMGVFAYAEQHKCRALNDLRLRDIPEAFAGTLDEIGDEFGGDPERIARAKHRVYQRLQRDLPKQDCSLWAILTNTGDKDNER